MKPFLRCCLFFVFIFSTAIPAFASHIVGGEITYVFLGDSTSGLSGKVYQKYRVSLSIYEDCVNGQPEAIAQDNPALMGVFDAATKATYELDTNIFFATSITVPNKFSSPCGTITSFSGSFCLIKKTFIKTYALLANGNGYVVAYERCCRNASIANINSPGNQGATYYCTIPPSGTPNNSAVFTNYPPQTICLNHSLFYDHSATDADGDSLSYSFCAALNGANDADIKPLPYYPNWADSVTYISPYSSQIPFTGLPPIVIDPHTGIITGTPNKAGRYLVTVRCSEWRNGALINTIEREFQFLVTADCGFVPYAPFAGLDTIIMVGDSVRFNAIGGISYSWTPATYLNDPSIGNPVGFFPVAGRFTYTLHEVSDSNCDGTATRTITVLDYAQFTVPTAFTPNNDGNNDFLKPLPVLSGATLVNFKVFNRQGHLVYDGGPNDPGWDGYYKGVKQDLGVYYWEILYRDDKGTERRLKGDATLVR